MDYVLPIKPCFANEPRWNPGKEKLPLLEIDSAAGRWEEGGQRNVDIIHIGLVGGKLNGKILKTILMTNLLSLSD